MKELTYLLTHHALGFCPICSRSTDLHLKYFISFKIHFTKSENKISRRNSDNQRKEHSSGDTAERTLGGIREEV